MVLRCNHTIIYVDQDQEERQGPLLQLLRVSGIKSIYNIFSLSLDFHITASLLTPGLKTKQNKIKKNTIGNFIALHELCEWM